MNVELLRLLSKQVKLSQDTLTDYAYMNRESLQASDHAALTDVVRQLRDAVRRINEVVDNREE